MRSRLAIGFIVLYLIALGRPIAPLIDYYVNQDFFATVLCVNKANPEMHCNGQCVLMRKLNAATEETGNVPVSKIDFKDYPIGFVKTLQSKDLAADASSVIGASIYGDRYRMFRQNDFFHPPPATD